MGRGAFQDLEAAVVARYPACWATLTRVVLGTGVGLLAVITVLLQPWAMLFLLVAAVATSGWLARLWRALLPIGIENRRLLGLFVAAVTACVGWGLVLGAPGLAVVALDAVAGLPVLIRATAKPGRAIASGGPATRLRLTLGREPRPVPAPRGRAPAGLDGLTPALGETLPPSDEQQRLLDQLSDAELRHAWQASCRALLMAHHPAVTERIVEARGRYLDAMAQRDPEWFTKWALSSLNATQPLQDGSELDH